MKKYAMIKRKDPLKKIGIKGEDVYLVICRNTGKVIRTMVVMK